MNFAGELDEPTQVLMNSPRCGVEDNMAVVDVEENENPIVARRKRYIIQKAVEMGQKWNRRDLKYRVTKYSQKIDAATIDGVLRKAFYVSARIFLIKKIAEWFFKEWQKAGPFTITPKPEGPIHLDIKFEPGDGPGKALAYAYGPGPG